jgi:hypothetical protein
MHFMKGHAYVLIYTHLRSFCLVWIKQFQYLLKTDSAYAFLIHKSGQPIYLPSQPFVIDSRENKWHQSILSTKSIILAIATLASSRSSHLSSWSMVSISLTPIAVASLLQNHSRYWLTVDSIDASTLQQKAGRSVIWSCWGNSRHRACRRLAGRVGRWVWSCWGNGGRGAYRREVGRVGWWEYEVIEGTAGTEYTEKRWEGDGRQEYEQQAQSAQKRGGKSWKVGVWGHWGNGRHRVHRKEVRRRWQAGVWTASTECAEKRWEELEGKSMKSSRELQLQNVQKRGEKAMEGRSMKLSRERQVQSAQKRGEKVMAGRSIEVIEGTAGIECAEERWEGDSRQEYEVVKGMAGTACTEERWEEGQWGRMRKRLEVKGMAGRWEGEWVIDLGCHIFINQRKGLLSTLGEQTSGRDKAGVEVRLVWAWIELKDMANVN